MKYRSNKKFKMMFKTGCLLWISSILPAMAGTFNLGPDVTISETDGTLSLEITRSSAVGEVSIQVSTSAGTALKGVDFEAIDSRTLDFPDGVSTASFPILVTDDNYSECEETFVVRIDSVPNGDSVSGGTLTVTVEDDDLMDLIWDDGSERNGSNGVYIHPDNQEGIYCFRVNTSPANEFNLWRTVLLVSAGEADLAMHRGPFGAGERADHESSQVGSDGILLTDSQFNPSQEWYIRVNAQPGAEWSLFTGDIHVIQQGELLLDTDANYAPIQTTFPPEGALFVQVETTVNTRAWAIWLNGYAKDSEHADIAIKKNTPSLPSLANTYDFIERNQSLMTPPYLGEGSDAYFFSLEGNPGDAITIDSHLIEPQTIAAGSSIENITQRPTGAPYAIFQVNVPNSYIAWDIALNNIDLGAPNLAVQSGAAGGPWWNKAYTEAEGVTQKSLTLVPPTLTDGSWYITVYSDRDFEADLNNGPLEFNGALTNIDFLDDDARTLDPIRQPGADGVSNPLPNRSGWVYFRADKITEQEGLLGWNLSLLDQVDSTEIAIRQNAVPGRLYYRNAVTTGRQVLRDDRITTRTDNHYDAVSDLGFLQRPSQQADVWYVGIHQSDTELGAFELQRKEIQPVSAVPNGFISQIAAAEPHLPKTWRFFRFDLLDGMDAWRTEIDNVLAGNPKLIIRRALLPNRIQSIRNPENIGNIWDNGVDVWYAHDWFTRQASETYRSLMLASEDPLTTDPGAAITYYVGIFNDSEEASIYKFSSEIIDEDNQPYLDQTTGVDLIDFSMGSASIQDLPAGQAKYFKTTIPENTQSWRLRLNNINGDARLFVRKGFVPDHSAEVNKNAQSHGGVEMAREGSEVFHILPSGINSEFIAPGDYFIVVVSELQSTFSGNLVSEGSIPVQLLQALNPVASVNYNLPGDEIGIYQFEITEDTIAVDIRLEELTGKVDLAIREDNLIPSPSSSGTMFYLYGYDGDNLRIDADFAYTLQNPDPGIYTITLRAERSNFNTPLSASGILRVTAVSPVDLEFNDGEFSIVDQEPNSWKYFKVIIPDSGIIEQDTDPILGWLLSFHNTSASGSARLSVTRGAAPPESMVNRTLGFVPTNTPSKSLEWPIGATWVASRGWANRTLSSDRNRHEHKLFAAWGKPLQGGAYYIGVLNDSNTENFSYTLKSRTLGQPLSSSNMVVTDLEFENGSIVQKDLEPAEIKVYRVTIPDGGAPSWRLRLIPENDGEVAMAIREAFPADLSGGGTVLQTIPNDDRSLLGGGTLIQKDGSELYQLLPAEGEALLSGGTQFYITVISEGHDPERSSVLGMGPVSYEIKSEGSVPNQEIVLESGLFQEALSFEPGEIQLFTFYVPENASSLEIELSNETGNNLNFAVRPGSLIPEPYNVNSFAGEYGVDEGTRDGQFLESQLETISDPVPGVYTLAIRNEVPSATSFVSQTTGDLRIQIIGDETLAFTNGSVTQTAHPPFAWRFYTVIVPEDDSSTRNIGDAPQPYLGWDIGIDKNYQGGSLQMYIRRDEQPLISGIPQQQRNRHWVEPHQIRASRPDWTNDSNRYEDNKSVSSLRELFAMDQPLRPGRYVIGIYNNNFNNETSSYTLRSKSIGTQGSGADYVVHDLNFQGGQSTVSVEPRQANYFRVSIPENTYRSWHVRLNNIIGETGMSVKRDFVPDFQSNYNGNADSYSNSARMQRNGSEIYTLLPKNNTEFIPGGDYFIAIYGQGSDGTYSNVGTGSSTATLVSTGELAETPLGEISNLNTRIVQSIDLEASGIELYSFQVEPATQILEIRLENRTGDPRISVRRDNLIPKPYINISTLAAYGSDYGNNFDYADPQIITILNPDPGLYTLNTASNSPENNPEPATADLVIEAVGVTPLAFTSQINQPPALVNEITSALIDGQNDYYEVTVPEFITIPANDKDIEFGEGQEIIIPIVAWKLELAETVGDVRMRVHDELTPTGGFTTSYADDVAVVVPPFLVPGQTYYIEVSANGIAEYQITSSAVYYQNIWSLPAEYNQNFGDSLQRDLAEDDWDFYAVDVPKSNGGLLRTELVAISGDPNLYIREDGVPTINHSTGGTAGQIVDRQFTGAETQYANWTPLQGSDSVRLKPGRWVIGIRAKDGNARYQLKVSTGSVQDLIVTEAGVVLENQNVLSNDFKYYRVVFPEIDSPEGVPAGWTISFTEDTGDVNFHLRDTVPPGHGTQLPSSANSVPDYIVDIDDDNKNQWDAWGGGNSGIDDPGTYEFTFPNLRPGSVYYIGIRGRLDGSFDLSSSISVTKVTDPVGSNPEYVTYGNIEDVDYFSGSVSFQLGANEYRAFRVQAPAGATRFVSASAHNNNVQFRLEQGTLPRLDVNSHQVGNGTNTAVNRALGGNWPWRAGEDYYILFLNEGAEVEDVEFSMLGEGALTGFGGWASTFGLNDATAEMGAINNPQGISNLMAYALGLNPTIGVPVNATVDPLPILILSDGDPVFPGLEFHIPSNAPSDICYIVESANDLISPWITLSTKVGGGGWVGSGYVLQLPVPGSYTRQTLFLDESIGASPQKYIRLRVELIQ
jgi:hypothetical protein